MLTQIKELKEKLCSLPKNTELNIKVDSTLIEAILNPIMFWNLTRNLLAKNILPSPQFKEQHEVADIQEIINTCNDNDKIYYTLNYLVLTNPIVKPVINKFFEEIKNV